MEIRNKFQVSLPPEMAWKKLLDVERIVHCVPGAELTAVIDERTYDGTVLVRLGPVVLTFAGQVIFENIDNEKHKARMKAHGKDAKGRGTAHADVNFEVVSIESGSEILVCTDLVLAGAVAQYGRASGVIQDTATQLVGEFATAFRAQLNNSGNVPGQSSTKPMPKVRPISGFSLILTVLRNALRRFFGFGAS